MIYEGNIQKSSQGVSHGDMLIEFIQSYNDELTIYVTEFIKDVLTDGREGEMLLMQNYISIKH